MAIAPSAAQTGKGDSARPATIHSFQWMRAFGAVAIVALHALITAQIAGGFDDLGTTRIMLESAFSIPLTRWAVPAFFMMSGALMLDPAREVTWAKIGKHVWRLAFVLLTIGFCFCLVESVLDAGGLSLAAVCEALVDFACARSWDHLWFVYVLLGFYLLTPIMRPFIAQASQRELLAVVVFLAINLQGISTLKTLLGWDLWVPVRLPANLTWYVLGYYAHRFLRFDGRFALAGAASLVAALVARIAFAIDWAGMPEHALVLPYALAVFLAFERYLEVPLDGHPLVTLLADYSFGIYLVHPAFQHAMVALFDVGAYPALAVDAALTVVPLALSIPTVWILRRLPGFGDKL